MHQIRLAGPWEVRTADSEDWSRTQLPINCPPNTTISLRRRFHKPGGLTAETEIRVAIAPQTNGMFYLNGDRRRSTICDETTLIDVTNALRDFNEFTLELTTGVDETVAVENVWIQIIEEDDAP